MSQGFAGKNFTFQRWDGLYHPTKNLSLSMLNFTTTYNWATGTSTDNLFSLTTDASANGTGALLNIATGASSTVLPLLVKAGATTGLTINASAQVLVGTLTSGRVTYAGTNGLLQDSANMTFNGDMFVLATTGNTGGLLIGGDANLYRSAVDVLKTDDSLVVGVNLTVNSLTTTRIPYASTSGLLIDSANMVFNGNRVELATTGNTGGLLIGGDANLYRDAADSLKTDDSLVVGVNLTVNSLTTTRVPFASTSGLLIDSSNFTYTTGTGQLALATTGSGGGILIGGDVQWYRDAANVFRTPDSVRVDGTMAIGAATSSTVSLQMNATHSVAGTAYTGVAVSLTHNATGTVTSRVFGMTFAVIQSGAGTFDDAGQLGCAGIEGSASFSGSVTSRGAMALIGTPQNTGTGTLERCVALFANTTNANTSSGHITNLRSIDVGWSTTFTANNQRRTALRIGTGPTNAGSFSGCIGGAIWFNSSSRLAVDGLLWGTGGDTNLYSSASDTLKTDDSLLIGRATAAGVVTLSDGATPALDASLGNTFLLTAAGDRTIAVPTNPTSGQRITIVHKASGANRTLALNTGAGGFRFGTTITALTITTSALTDYIECIYNAADSKWDVVGYNKGF